MSMKDVPSPHCIHEADLEANASFRQRFFSFFDFGAPFVIH